MCAPAYALKRWKALKTSDKEILDSLGRLGCKEEFKKKDEQLIERFICHVYLPGTTISDIGLLRWYMFTKKGTQSKNLPPTRSTLTPYILRTHYKVMEWRRANQQHPNRPEPSHFGWEMVEHQYSPVMCTLLCAPESILQLVRCSRLKGRCAVHCKCQTQSLRCTELCKCGGDEDLCENNDVEDNKSDFRDSDNEF